MTVETTARAEEQRFRLRNETKIKSRGSFVSSGSALTHVFLVYVPLFRPPPRSCRIIPLRLCLASLSPSLISSVPISHDATYIEHFLFVPSASQASQSLAPAVILQATRHVNYYANKQCETSVPTSHKTARIPSDFRVASVLRMAPRLPAILSSSPPFRILRS